MGGLAEHTEGRTSLVGTLFRRFWLMSLYHARRGSRNSDLGKFQSRTALATTKKPGGEYLGWHYDFVAHQSGSSVKRTRYAVSIKDPHHNPVEYLRGFSSIAQATQAARDWLDAKLGKVLTRLPAGQIGKIPSMPSADAVASE